MMKNSQNRLLQPKRKLFVEKMWLLFFIQFLARFIDGTLCCCLVNLLYSWLYSIIQMSEKIYLCLQHVNKLAMSNLKSGHQQECKPYKLRCLGAKVVCTRRAVLTAQMRPKNAIGSQFHFVRPRTLLETATFCLSIHSRTSQSIAYKTSCAFL